MADATANTVPEGTPPTADAGGKKYDESYVKQLIAERDDAKHKARSYAEEKEKQEAERLKVQGDYKSLAEKANADLEALKPHVEKSKQLEEVFNKLLTEESKGIEDIADAIISNGNLSYEEKMSKIRTLKEKLNKLNGGQSVGGATGGATRKQITDDEFMKLPAIERARIVRERITGAK